MKTVVYIIIFAVVALIFKAMFLDDYLKETDHMITEVNESIPENNIPIKENNITYDNNITSKITSKSEFQKKMDDTPLDRFFNSVAEKLDKKL